MVSPEELREVEREEEPWVGGKEALRYACFAFWKVRPLFVFKADEVMMEENKTNQGLFESG